MTEQPGIVKSVKPTTAAGTAIRIKRDGDNAAKEQMQRAR
jgi:hypothetical protein